MLCVYKCCYTIGSKIINTRTPLCNEDATNAEQENQISLPTISSSNLQKEISDLYPLLSRFVLLGKDLIKKFSRRLQKATEDISDRTE